MTLPPMPPLPNIIWTAEQIRIFAEQYGRLCAEAERGRLASDAANWGSALNDAGWEFMDSYRRHIGEVESGKLFNSAKSILRDCIAVYFANLSKDAIRARSQR